MASAFVAQAVPPQQIVYEDRFQSLENWVAELEQPGTVSVRGGVLTIDVPAGCTPGSNRRSTVRCALNMKPL